ncbi:ubiquitin carboxyl-terminal hydrolase MINDY-1 isoform X2 [Cuculus canorus]|uniref:ubiquitin carboxyl-terminal hydrolase MINDY-1 isoform X2 n=1 Tax=Cuculus canorus TaxID=55661 RepID=UPI0023AAD65A|nr:ubiquitin carboxyl-terminal hydrolase MINDY-1 isoform X2 [Cuculus canorus]
MEQPLEHGGMEPAPSSDEATPQLPNPSSDEGTPQLLVPSSDEGTPQLPNPSSDEGTPQLPDASSDEGTLQLLNPSSNEGTPKLPDSSSDERTPKLPDPSSDERTPKFPDPSSDEGTPKLPDPSSDERTPKLPDPSSDEGTHKLPDPSSDEETPKLPDPSSDEGTPKLPDPSSDEGTPKLPDPSSDERTPKLPDPSSDERTPKLPDPSSDGETPQLPVEGAGMPADGRESPAVALGATVPYSGEQDLPSSPGVGQPGCAPHLPSDDAGEKQPAEGGGSLLGTLTPSPGAGVVGLQAEPPQTSTSSREVGEDFYCVKWITWKGERTPVIMQSANGPCPLLAIMNILFLQWKVKLPPQKEMVTAEELMAHLGDCILSTQPREPSEGLQLNFQQNIHDTMMVLPKLSTGLDVNVRFTGVSDFEYTPECIIFDLLNVPLYHGWLVDPQSLEVVQAVGKLSYNQLVEKIITCKQASDSSLVSEGLVAEQFLETTASQLTYHGLCELTAAVREGELSVFFRNNHFSTMIKHKGHLYLLVTDQGFLQEERVVWESLHNVDGDSCFCDTEFHLSHAEGKEGATVAALDHQLQQSQVDQQQQGQDPSALSDLELARQLQQEEYQQHHLQQQPRAPAQGRAQTGGRPAGERRQRQRPDLDCTLL